MESLYTQTVRPSFLATNTDDDNDVGPDVDSDVNVDPLHVLDIRCVADKFSFEAGRRTDVDLCNFLRMAFRHSCKWETFLMKN